MADTAICRTHEEATAERTTNGGRATAAGRRTVALALTLTSLSAVALAVLHGTGTLQLDGAGVLPAGVHPVLAWWSIAALAVLAEFMAVEVEFRGEVSSFTFSEVPMVLGLFLAEPLHLIAGRLLGEAVFLVLRERQPTRKVALNLSVFAAETTTLLAIFHVLDGTANVTNPSDWIRALVAIAVADLVGFLVVAVVMRWHGTPLRLRSVMAIGAVTVPVNTSLALLLGVLTVDRPWAVFLVVALFVSTLLASRSYTSLRKRHQSLTLLYDFTRIVSRAQHPDDVLEAMLAQMNEMLRAERAEIWLDDGAHELGDLPHRRLKRLVVDERGQRTESELDVDVQQVSDFFTTHRGTVIVDGGGVGRASARRRATHPSLRRSAIERSRVLGSEDVLRELRATDAIVAPISDSGRVIGLVAVVDRIGELVRFDEVDRQVFDTLAHHASVALENGRLIDRLHQEARRREHEARHDALTGLPNRVLFGEQLRARLDAAVAGGAPVAVGLMDLDGFKAVNDTLGHHTGDMVLAETARRLSHAVSLVAPSALVARLGGDEFALLVVGDDTGRDALHALALRVCSELARPLRAEGVAVDVRASVGFAIRTASLSSSSSLLQAADLAMYAAKAAGGSCVAFHEPSQQRDEQRRQRLATELAAAFGTDQLTIVYQPTGRLRDGEVTGFEALLRWRHPEFGQVLPEEFIPIAERSGQLHDLTMWVLAGAACQAAEWWRDGHRWSVAVNVSMRSLLHPRLVVTVARAVLEAGCDPAAVTLEITEADAMRDDERVVEVMRDLAALGVGLSVDDFGTGYSSLALLQRLPVHEVKVDQRVVRSMVGDAGADAIVRSIVDLAAHLGLEVVAEGVEDQATWDRLRRLGCSRAQGYHLARPMSASDVHPWIASRTDRSAPAHATSDRSAQIVPARAGAGHDR